MGWRPAGRRQEMESGSQGRHQILSLCWAYSCFLFLMPAAPCFLLLLWMKAKSKEIAQGFLALHCVFSIHLPSSSALTECLCGQPHDALLLWQSSTETSSLQAIITHKAGCVFTASASLICLYKDWQIWPMYQCNPLRITELSELEGILKGTLVQLPCNNQGHLQMIVPIPAGLPWSFNLR